MQYNYHVPIAGADPAISLTEHSSYTWVSHEDFGTYLPPGDMILGVLEDWLIETVYGDEEFIRAENEAIAKAHALDNGPALQTRPHTQIQETKTMSTMNADLKPNSCTYHLTVGADIGDDNGIFNGGTSTTVEEAIAHEQEEFAYKYHEFYGPYIKDHNGLCVAESNGHCPLSATSTEDPNDRACTCGSGEPWSSCHSGSDYCG